MSTHDTVIFCYFCQKTYFVGTHWNCLDKAILVSTHKMLLFYVIFAKNHILWVLIGIVLIRQF